MKFDDFVSKQRAESPELDKELGVLQSEFPNAKTYTEFLTQSNLNDFTFRHHRGVMAPPAALDKDTVVAEEMVATANLKLAPYGYTMAKDLLDACLKASRNRFNLFFDELFEFVTKDVRAIDSAKIVWPNYPDDVMKADEAVLYIANLFHYLSGGEWQPKYNIQTVAPALSMNDVKNLRQIPLCPKDGAINLVVEMLSGQMPLSAEDVAELRYIMSDTIFADTVAGKLEDSLIPVKENLALYVAMIMPVLGRDIEHQHCLAGFTTAQDVLRLAVACSEGDISLATKTLFRNFKRSERRFLLGLIEKTQNIPESMAKDAEVWKRLGEKLHPGEFQNMYPETAKAFGMIRSGSYIETYNGKLEQLMKQPVDAEKLSEHLLLRPGMFARYLDFCLRNCKDDSERNRVAFRFITVAQKVAPRVLLQVINHFRNRNNAVQLAVGKRSGAAAQTLERNVAPLDKAFCNNLADDIANELWQLLRHDKPNPVSVYIDPDSHCEKIIFPDNIRHLSSGTRSATCGSRFPMPEGNTLRCFLYWKAKEWNVWNGIDLDLSVAFMNGNFEYNDRQVINFQRPKLNTVNGIHSGDRRSSGPKGSVEYVDFDLDAARRAGFRYAALYVNVYSGVPFDQMDAAFCGVMVRDGTGDKFEPTTVTDKFYLTAQSRDLVAVVLDLAMNEIIVVDRASGSASGDTVNSSSRSISNICQYAAELKSTTLSKMLQYRFPSLTKDWENADVIISDVPDKFKGKKENARVISPFDAQGILNLIFD